MSEGQAKSWFDQGYGGIGREEERIANMSGPFRVWIPAGKSVELVLVDDEPMCIYEHQWKMNGHWRNWATCMQGVHDQVICCQEGGERSRSYVGYLTSIMCTATTDKKGNTYQYEMQLFGAKLKTLKKFRRKKEENGTLALTRFKVTREDQNSPSCGDDFERLAEVKDMAKLFELANYRGKKLTELWDKAEQNQESMNRLKRVFQLAFEDGSNQTKLIRKVVPFNYMELLKPKTPKEMGELFKMSKIESDDGTADKGGGSGGKADEEVPF
jgi:hypothetical protein